MNKREEILRRLPSVDRILQHPIIHPLSEKGSRRLILEIIREELENYRQQITNQENLSVSEEEIVSKIGERIRQETKPSLKKVINGLGVILHTGLGRAPLSKEAQEALLKVSSGYSNLEIESRTGRRGSRHRHLKRLLSILTGAEASLVVNNNAAATFLILNSLAVGKEVIVSRGELIEIGGAFRLPEIMESSGAKMVEVGTTNRTYLYDYEKAISEDTTVIFKVHQSNYRMVGFATQVPLEELAVLAKKAHLILVDDLGSGALIDLSKYGLEKEPVVRESIEKGADLVCFSGDKLLGGPQAGIIVGKREYIELLKKNQLVRCLRCGKITYAALEATLRLFLDEDNLQGRHPVMRLLTRTIEDIEKATERLLKMIEGEVRGEVEMRRGVSKVGGGSLPLQDLPSSLLFIKPLQISVDELALRLRLYEPPIFCRVEDEGLVIDLRAVEEGEIEIVAKALKEIL